jgi:hypothetical protein
MKTTPVLGALFALMVLAACETENPAAPDMHAQYAKGSATGSGTVAVSLSDGSITSAPQTANVVSNISTKLELSAHESKFRSALVMTANRADCNVDRAVTPQIEAKLQTMLSKLVDAEQNRFFSFYVNRAALNAESADHNLGHTFTDEDGRLYTVRIGSAKLLPGPKATITEGPSRIYTITGGVIVIADRTGGASQHVYMACPNTNSITVTVGS